MASGQTEYIKKGSTDVTMYVNLVQNTSGASPGEDLTGLVFNSTGLKAYYTVNNTNPLPITLVTTTTTAAHVDGGFVETSAANTPGEYKFCLPDIVFALGTKVRVTISGHAQLLTHVINVVITAIDLYDAQRMGLVSLPNIGTLAVKPILASGVHTGAEIPVTGTVTDGAKDSTVAKDATVMKTTHINATAGKVDSVGAVDSVTGAVGSVTAGVTVTANNDKTGYSLTQSFPANFSDMAITVTTGQVTVGTNADKSGYSISGTKTTLDALNDVSAADVNAQCDQALLDYDAPTNTEMTAAFTEIKGATFSGATDSLEAIRDRGDAAWTTGAGGTPPDLLQSTTIATLATQTSFTLTAGSADDAAYAGHIAIITDSVTSTQKCVADISTYTGATKTVTLASDPAVFTMAAGDTIDIIAATGAGGSGATAAEVWGYATRALTDKAGFTISGTKTTLDSLNDVAATDIVSAGAITTLAGAVVNVDTVDSVTGSVGSVSGNVDGSVGSLGAQAKLDVNAEADTALSDYGALKPTVAGRTLDVTLTGEAGIDLDNTVGTLAKGTDITGFNDIAATDVVTDGAITTLAGAVVNVDTVDVCATNSDMRGTDGANTVVPDAAGTAPTAVEIRTEMDANSAKLRLLADGVIQSNTAGGFHVQMLDTAGDPVASQAVTMTRRLDNGAFASATGTASNTDANGVSYVAYSATDVNGTDAVAFKFSATGAKDTYVFAKLSV